MLGIFLLGVNQLEIPGNTDTTHGDANCQVQYVTSDRLWDIFLLLPGVKIIQNTVGNTWLQVRKISRYLTSPNIQYKIKVLLDPGKDVQDI